MRADQKDPIVSAGADPGRDGSVERRHSQLGIAVEYVGNGLGQEHCYRIVAVLIAVDVAEDSRCGASSVENGRKLLT